MLHTYVFYTTLGKIEMRIKANKKKLRRAYLSLGIPSAFFFLVAGLITFMELNANGSIDSQKWILILGMLSIAITGGFPLFHLMRIRKYFDGVILLDDGVLRNYSSIFNWRKEISVNEIESVNLWSKAGTGFVTKQYKVSLKSKTGGGGQITAQLRGNNIYLTDFLVESTDLERLINEIKTKLPNKG